MTQAKYSNPLVLRLRVLHDRLSDSLIRPFDGQDSGERELIRLPGKEGDGFKAGLGFRRAADKCRIVGQAVIIRQIAEGEPVSEEERLKRSISLCLVLYFDLWSAIILSLVCLKKPLGSKKMRTVPNYTGLSETCQ